MTEFSADDEDDIFALRLAAELAGLDIPDIVLPRDVHIVLRGMRFHYLDWGETEGRSIVFLHGRGLTAHTYDLVCIALHKTYHCLSLDQRGHGDSEWSPQMDYRIETHAADIDSFIRELHLRDLVLVGMSMGGLNALQYAAAHSDRLAALVLIDTGPDVHQVGAKRIRDFLSRPTEPLPIDEYVARAKEFNPRRDVRLLRRSLRHNLREIPGRGWVWKYDRRSSTDPDAQDSREPYGFLWDAVDRITCPTLIVRGAESDLFSDDDAERLAGRLVDGRWTRVEAAGHTVQGDNPAGLVRVLRTFLDDRKII